MHIHLKTEPKNIWDKTHITKGKTIQLNHRWKLRYHTLNNGWNWIEDKQEKRRPEKHYKLTRPNRHIPTFPQIPAEYTLISRAYGTFSRADLMLYHKTSLNKFWKTEIIQSSPTTMELNYKWITEGNMKNS